MSEVRPLVLLYNMDTQRKAAILAISARMRIKCKQVHVSQYHLTIEDLISETQTDNSESIENSFTEPMLLMSGFTSGMMNTFLNSLRAHRVKPIALKAMLTPVNRKWSSVRLHDEILKEHLALHERKP